VLYGWKEIAAYMRKPERTLQTWVKLYGFPVARAGERVMTTATLIDGFVVAKALARRRRDKAAPSYMGTFWSTTNPIRSAGYSAAAKT
jgi:hypothetical protein